jgi:hypothetical protein
MSAAESTLSDPGRDAARFVRRSRVVILGTTSAGALPFATPLWFARARGVLYLTTGSGSWAGRNIGHHPEVTLLFGGERGRGDRRRLLVDGTAVLHHGLPPARVLIRLTLQYYLPPRRAWVELRHLRQWRFRRQYYGQTEGGAGFLEVRVRRARFLPPN